MPMLAVQGFAEHFYAKRVGHLGEARARVAAFPFFPDALAITAVVASNVAARRKAATKGIGAAQKNCGEGVHSKKPRAVSFPF